MLVVTNRAEFSSQVKGFINSARAQAENRLAGVMKGAQLHATLHSPVWSGDFASNWNVSYGTPDTTFIDSGGDYMRSSSEPGKEYKMNPLSSAIGLPPGNFNMVGFRLGQPVYLTNAAEHDEPYAWLIENNQIKFRSVNVGKHGVGAKAAGYILRNLGT